MKEEEFSVTLFEEPRNLNHYLILMRAGLRGSIILAKSYRVVQEFNLH